ncbi:hypothetical protein AJ79_05181 [Helicocarpus griseus UAMH5409]|uniref:RRM domain-containing protein n=1 Tax=Helicocarpus griseus UAMH5409 TaxID=1447875 RepID=A0A2B7XPQ8_9EURO|nr:hypothetical protein AJ79_05181 [Helicocarpus griseus UAMH5409]
MPGLKETSPSAARKRKLDDGPALEIDLSAPEPPSKKALRKSKKKSAVPATEATGEVPASTSTSAPTPTAKPQPAEQAEKPSKRSEYGVWIGNLPFTAKKDDIRQFFTSHGNLKDEEITRLHLPEGAKQNGKAQNKGFAYVDFTTKTAMEAAIEMSEQLISGRRALIKNANSFVGRPDKPKDDSSNTKSSKGPANAPSQRIFVGNLGFDVTKEILELHFKPCGGIEDIHVATFEDSGKCKGYAWVVFESVDGAESAVRGFVKVPEEDEEDVEESDAEESSDAKKKNKKPRMKRVWVNRIMGRPLRMEFAEDKATRYKKRFGKEGTSKDKFAKGPNEGEEHVGGHEAPAIEEVPDKKTRSYQLKDGKNQGSSKKGAGSGGRYAQDVVQRLSGAIVEAQGKKTTFD